ncbi:hypothetical protein CISG_00005 [Coccidioides immitis RMSCC 3703]|uniref:Uncharacterized protein n=2 Tax=Coccidioides immitis TaxID=5501 RepID=A0A0J8QH05_COCIT|nr:hypothetical protein CIRG_07525 [Coccidioides immitis RMSCC 2394]KMU71695.1 hypothetical protein CISG_00005 [Coccidioides immitis RMSCC 3703]
MALHPAQIRALDKIHQCGLFIKSKAPKKSIGKPAAFLVRHHHSHDHSPFYFPAKLVLEVFYETIPDRGEVTRVSISFFPVTTRNRSVGLPESVYN